MVHLRDKFFAVEVPETAYDIIICGNRLEGNKQTGSIMFFRDLLPGKYRLVCLTKQVTEEAAKQVVEWNEHPTQDEISGYENYVPTGIWAYPLAVRSLTSLLKSKGLDTEKNYAIIAKL